MPLDLPPPVVVEARTLEAIGVEFVEFVVLEATSPLILDRGSLLVWDSHMNVPRDVAAFGDEVAAILDSIVGDELVGAYFVGSIALGGYVRGQSDTDIAAVCRQRLTEETKKALADRLTDATPDCPARGLEFTLYRAEVASAPEGADFEVNVNGGPRMPREVRLSSHDQPRFWYMIDRAIAHRHGIAICGAPSADVFASLPRKVLLEVLAESTRWHREHEKATLYSVLNATRAWRFAVEDVLGSKLDGAEWARRRWRAPWLIDAAVELRHGRPGHLNPRKVDQFLAHVESVLDRAE